MSAATETAIHTGLAASLRRVRAVLRRHGYLIVRSPARIVSMMYYPTVTMVVWGFVTLYLAPTNNFLRDAPGFFIGAVLQNRVVLPSGSVCADWRPRAS